VRVGTTVLSTVTTLVLAGCGGDGDSTTEAKVSPEEEIAQIGNKWAPLFAAGDDGASCAYENQPVCERIACERVGHAPIENCTRPSAAFRRSFEDATVQDIAIKGQNAGVKFSNGEVVQFMPWNTVQPPGDGPNPNWVVARIGGDPDRTFSE
jgi:hypothetical protein